MGITRVFIGAMNLPTKSYDPPSPMTLQASHQEEADIASEAKKSKGRSLDQVGQYCIEACIHTKTVLPGLYF